jgi:hypothetical protein
MTTHWSTLDITALVAGWLAIGILAWIACWIERKR